MLPTTIFTVLFFFLLGVEAILHRNVNFGANPSGLEMNIYVPLRLSSRPAVILALHGCLGSGTQYQLQTTYDILADSKGFLVIYPSSKKDSNCWDVASTASLKRNGGGDTTGLINMINYTIQTYNADPRKIFVTGSSSGAMMTNVLCALYPEVFAAASAYSGIPAGCLAGSPGSSPFSADQTCANGLKIKSQAEWVTQAKNMYPGYTGAYPKILVWHGTADNIVKYPNLGEQIKQWSGLHGVTFSSNVANSPISGYTKMVYGDGSKFNAYSAAGVGHTVPVEEAVDLAWFGL